MIRRERHQEESQNFWISYADLMAGLLFVFILLIGAIVSKTVLMRENLHKKENILGEVKLELKRQKLELNRVNKILAKAKRDIRVKDAKIYKQKIDIKDSKNLIKLKDANINRLNSSLKKIASKLKKQYTINSNLNRNNKNLKQKLTKNRKNLNILNSKLHKKDKLIASKIESVHQKEQNLKELKGLLLVSNLKIDELNKQIALFKNISKESNMTLDQKQKLIRKYANKVLVLSSKLNNAKDELRLKDERIIELLNSLNRQKISYDELLKHLQKQRSKIKSLTGIHLKVIEDLKKTLGNKIAIDKKSGALRLSSKILFDKGSSRLKERAKVELRESFKRYIAALMNNRVIRPHIKRIIIEGHTDSDGGYLYNLELSQKRALAVMKYLLTLPISKKYHLKKYLVASGRAYMDRIIRHRREDKDASRRIEIKFRLKNQDSMYEIERILDEDKINKKSN